MTETPVLFGPDGASLLGVIAAPEQPRPEPVACLLLNQGAGYRIGPRRINVKLARMLADRGIGSIRIDLSGLGDSGPASGRGDFLQQGIADLQAAMTLAQERLGARRFLLVGLCSGGTLGMALAQEDARVAGLLMFDSWSFPARRAVMERWARKIAALPFNPALREKTGKALRQRLDKQPQIFESMPPDEQQRRFCEAMRVLHARGAAVYMLSSASLQAVDRGCDQIGALAGEPWAPKLEYRFEPRIDHTLATLESQRIFLELTCDWAGRVAERAGSPPHAGLSQTAGLDIMSLSGQAAE